MNKHDGGQGFTLIELMITVAVIAILAAVALPGYQFAMRNTRRAEAQGCLMELQNFMERFYTVNGCYKAMAANTPCATSGTNPTLPFTEAPKDSLAKVYDLALQANDGNAYTLRATPKGSQAGDGIIEVDSTGARRWDKNNDASFGTAEQTWNR